MPTALAVLSLATTAVALAGVLVGVLGGLIGPVDDGLDVRVNVADR